MASPRRFDGKVRATRPGYCGGLVRKEGEIFDFNGILGSWMDPQEPSIPASKAPIKKASRKPAAKRASNQAQ